MQRTTDSEEPVSIRTNSESVDFDVDAVARDNGTAVNFPPRYPDLEQHHLPATPPYDRKDTRQLAANEAVGPTELAVDEGANSGSCG